MNMSIQLQKRRRLGLVVLTLLLSPGVSAAEILVDFALSEYAVDGSGSPTAPAPNRAYTHSDYVAAGVNASLTASNFMTGGGGSFNGELNVQGWGGTGRLDITLAPAAGLVFADLDLHSVTLNLARNGAQAPSQLDISANGGLTSLATIDGFATRSGSSGALPLTGFEHVFFLNTASAVQNLTTGVTLTVYLPASATPRTGNLRINNVVVEGAYSLVTASSIPEPAALTVTAIASLAVTTANRRQRR